MANSLAAQLEREEGRVRHAYQDHLGFWTIGVGHLIDSRKGGGLPDHIVDALLAHDIAEKTAEVERALPWVKTLDDPRRAVLIGMAFQMGTEGLLAFKNTLARVRAGNWAGAASGMLNSKWAQQTPERAQRMAKQMETGQWQL